MPKIEPNEELKAVAEALRPKMLHWGAVVTLFYLVAVLLLVAPMVLFTLTGLKWSLMLEAYAEVFGYWLGWSLLGICLGGQVLLLWLSVDTTRKRLKPRTHILVSATLTAVLIGVLTLFAALAVSVAIENREIRGLTLTTFLSIFALSWLLWGILFYRASKNADDAASRAVSWLLRGSVLELLVAVTSHVLVRQREDCSAPIVTGYGIATGLAIMLLSFGPSVLFLFKERVEKRRTSQQKRAPG